MIGSGATESQALRPWVRRATTMITRALRAIALSIGVAYPAALLVVAVVLRWVGEGWWLTATTLYMPRVPFAFPLPLVVATLLAMRMWRLLLAQIVSLVLIAFPLMGFVLPRPHFADPTLPTLRVLSFNIDGGDGGYAAVFAEIDAHAPDVVLLQEVGGKPGDLVARLGARYPTVDARGQFIVATRYPIASSSEPLKLEYNGTFRSPRFVQDVIDTPLGRIVFYNVHPISPRDELVVLKRHGLHGMLAGDSPQPLMRNVGLRTLQVETFSAAAAAEVDPVIIAGDTNLPDASRTLRRYLSAYDDGFTAAGWGFGYTFPTNKWRPWMRLDRIMASPQLRFTRFEVGHSLVSDHRCVVADLQRSAR